MGNLGGTLGEPPGLFAETLGNPKTQRNLGGTLGEPSIQFHGKEPWRNLIHYDLFFGKPWGNLGGTLGQVPALDPGPFGTGKSGQGPAINIGKVRTPSQRKGIPGWGKVNNFC